MKITELLHDQVVLEELGKRLGEYRLEQNLTQKELARQAGVSLSTLVRLEDGQSTNTVNLIRVMRGLGLLSNLEIMLPQTSGSPVDMFKRQGKTRQRASRKSKDDGSPKRWVWGDE